MVDLLVAYAKFLQHFFRTAREDSAHSLMCQSQYLFCDGKSRAHYLFPCGHQTI